MAATTRLGIAGLYRTFWRFAAGARARAAASSTLLVLSQVVKLAVPWLAAQAINTIQTAGAEGLRQAGLWIALIILASVVSWALHGPGRALERTVAVRVRSNLADGLYSKVTSLPLAWHERHHSGETLHRFEKTTHALADFAESQFIYLQNIVNLAGPVLALVLLSSTVGALAVIGYALIGFVIVRFDAVMMRLAERENQAERRYAAALVDCLGNISTLLALRLQQATRALLGARLAEVFVPLKRSIVLQEGKWCAVDLLTVVLSWGVVAAYAWLSSRQGGDLLLGNVFMVYQYTQQAGGVIISVAANYQQFARMQADYASADPIWQAAARPAAAGDIASDWREISIDGLEFKHAHSRGEEVWIRGASLALRRGERIALVGPSGAGKSTLMRVLSGLYDAERGRFAIDGVAQPGMKHLGPIATLIPQDAEVFEGSIRENLTFGVPYDDAAIATAVRIAAFDRVLASLPQGLETMISERGLNLSGGQKQRMALARGVLAASGSSLLLLDEPTSSLDAATEANVFEALATSFPRACIVCSVHRLSLLTRFDRVVLMANGEVVDTGTVDELLARQPVFVELWQRSAAQAMPVM